MGQYYFKRNSSSSLPTTIVIRSYDSKNKNINDLSRKENVEITISYLLSELIVNQKTKHLILPINNVDVKMNQISDLINNYPSLKKLKVETENGDINQNFFIHTKEHFFKTKLLKEYIKEENCNLKNVIFQIVHTLITIHNSYPGFRHNKLNVDNIILYLKKSNDSKTKYFVGKDIYDIKIFNFINSSIEDLVFNSDVSDNHNKKNKYYDIQYFLNDLLEYIDLDKCSTEFQEFINFALPNEFRGEKGLKSNKEYLVPEKILSNKYFDSLKVEVSDVKTQDDDYFRGYKKEYPFKVHMDNSEIDKLSDIRTIEGEVLYANKSDKKLNSDIRSDIDSITSLATSSDIKSISSYRILEKEDNNLDTEVSMISIGGYKKNSKKYDGSRVIRKVKQNNELKKHEDSKPKNKMAELFG